MRALEINCRFVAKHASADRGAKVIVGLKPGLHLFRLSGVALLACRLATFVHSRGWRRGDAPRGLEALLLAHAVGIDGRLVFKVERNCAKDLGKSQSFEFRQDRFRREALIKTLDDGIERNPRTGYIVAAVALFDVFFRHRLNYSGIAGRCRMSSVLTILRRWRFVLKEWVQVFA